MRGKRLSRLERPATLGRGNPLSALFIRPDGQTENERIEFDAAIKKHLAKGGAVSVFDESEVSRMSRNLDVRLYRLESALRQTGKPEVIFLWDETDDRWPEQQAEIERMKQAGRCLILLTEGNGGEAWEGERMVFSI